MGSHLIRLRLAAWGASLLLFALVWAWMALARPQRAPAEEQGAWTSVSLVFTPAPAEAEPETAPEAEAPPAKAPAALPAPAAATGGAAGAGAGAVVLWRREPDGTIRFVSPEQYERCSDARARNVEAGDCPSRTERARYAPPLSPIEQAGP